MSNNSSSGDLSIDEAKKEIDKIFLKALKDLEELHQEKMSLIEKYEEIDRAKEIEKIRKDLNPLKNKN